MTARQAASALGISPATLYSYVSRGMLRSARVPGDPASGITQKRRENWNQAVASCCTRDYKAPVV